MTLGRRWELLIANSAHNIAEPRRKELLNVLRNWIDTEECIATSAEELFYMLGAMSGIAMENYSKEIQTKIGGEILEKELAGK